MRRCGLPMVQMIVLLFLVSDNAVARLDGTTESTLSITPLHTSTQSQHTVRKTIIHSLVKEWNVYFTKLKVVFHSFI